MLLVFGKNIIYKIQEGYGIFSIGIIFPTLIHKVELVLSLYV